MLDWFASNLGSLLTAVSMLVIGLGAVFTMRNKIDAMSGRLAILEEKLEKLIEVLVQQGRHEERMAAMDQRLVNQGVRLDDIIKRFNDMMDARK